MRNSKKMMALLATFLACGTISAQESDFDLNAQRSESQEVFTVPGMALDHQGIFINPTPQSLKRTDNKTVNIAKGFSLKDKQNAFRTDLGFISIAKKGTPIVIDFGAAVAAKNGVKQVAEAY